MSKRHRKHETKGDIIAVLILQYCRDGAGRPIVTREQARTMTAEQIIRAWRSRVIRQHGTPHAIGGSCEPHNIWYTPREIDAAETPKDISRIAKGKRLAKFHARHLSAMAAKIGQSPPPLPERKKVKRRWPKRPFPGSKADRAQRERRT